jgi:hypothetical protein
LLGGEMPLDDYQGRVASQHFVSEAFDPVKRQSRKKISRFVKSGRNGFGFVVHFDQARLEIWS